MDDVTIRCMWCGREVYPCENAECQHETAKMKAASAALDASFAAHPMASDLIPDARGVSLRQYMREAAEMMAQ